MYGDETVSSPRDRGGLSVVVRETVASCSSTQPHPRYSLHQTNLCDFLMTLLFLKNTFIIIIIKVVYWALIVSIPTAPTSVHCEYL